MLWMILQTFVILARIQEVFTGCSIVSGLTQLKHCTIKHDGHNVLVDCSCVGRTNKNCHHQLKHSPADLPSYTSYLDLTGNKISRIKQYDFTGCYQMKFLNLSHNSIGTIEENSFDSLQGLSVLWIFNNKLDLSDQASMPDSLISKLTELTDLRTDNNNFEHQPGYNVEILSNKTKLQGYNLDAIDGVQFPAAFGKLPSLTAMSLYGNLTYLRNNTFELLKNSSLRKLFVRSKLLRVIESIALSPLTKLTTLSLDYNYKMNLSRSVSDAWYGISRSVTSLFLRNLVSYEKMSYTVVPDYFLPTYQETPKLKELYLDINRINRFQDENWPSQVPNLELLSLKYNKFRVTSQYFLNQVVKLKYLRYLDMSEQTYFHTDGCFIDANPNKNIANIFHLPPNLETLIWRDAFDGKFSNELKELTFSGAKRKLKQIDLSQNYIPKISGPLSFSDEHHELKVFNMSCLNIKSLSYNFVQADSNVSVHTLDISMNSLGHQINFDHNSRLLNQFQYLQLKVLIMTQNDIKYLRNKTFMQLIDLEILVLRDNAIHTQVMTLYPLIHLRILDMALNSIYYIKETSIKILEDISQHQLDNNKTFELDLSGNPFQVQCFSLSFLKLLLDPKGIKFLNVQKYTFISPHGEVPYTNLSSVTQTLEIKCSSKEWMIGVAAAFSILVFCLFVSILIFRHRWDIRYFMLRLTTDRKRYQRLVDNVHFKYDAFVAFHQSDFSWIRETLMTKLESDLSVPFKLCIHHRDWLPGPTIEENICESIRNSRKTLVILSKMFLVSGWCDFELQIARMHSFDVGQEVIIVIALEDIPLSKMTTTLINLRRRNTWLQWPETVSEMAAFWDLLVAALSHSGNAPIKCGCGRTFYPNNYSSQAIC